MTAPQNTSTSLSKGGAALPQGEPKRRTTAKVARAINIIATQGQTQRQASKLVGMNEDALSRALAQPHNRALLEDAKAQACIEADSLKPLARAIAIREGMDLMQNSPSHQVRARLVEFFAGEGRQPLVNIQFPGNQPPATGYQYERPARPGLDRASRDTDVQDADIVEHSPDVGD